MADDEGHGKELSEESQLDEQISSIEETFGEVIPRHRKVLQEEEDVVKKLEVAHRIIHNSEAVTEKLTHYGKGSGDMNDFIEDGFKNLVGLLRAVELEIQDIREELQEENSEIANLQQMEDKVREEADFMLDQHEAMFGDRLGDERHSDIDQLANEFQRKDAEEVKNTLGKRLDHYWNDLNLDELGVSY